jgi:TldD protein
MVSIETMARFAVNNALEKGARYIEARYERHVMETLVMRNGEVDAVLSRVVEGLNIRLIYNNILSMGSTNILTKSYIENLVDELISQSKVYSDLVKNPVVLSEEVSSDVDYFVAENIRWADIPIDEKIGFLRELDSIVIDEKYKSKFVGRNFILNYDMENKYYYNSEETRVVSTIPRVFLSFFITCKYDGNYAQKYSRIAGSGGFEVVKREETFEEITSVSEALDKVLTEAISIPEGRMDIIVGSEVAGIIAHEAVGHPFEADRILGRETAQAGRSYVNANMVGERIGSDEVVVVDDPTIPGSYGFYLYDDEGVKARKRVLIKNGLVNEFLLNREAAAKLNMKSNGAARAGGYDREPIVRMANTYFERGNYTFDELIEDVLEGIYIRSFMEWNIDDIRLNQRYTGLEAYIIDNGEVGKPVKNPVLETNTYDLLSRLDARGNDLKFYPGNCGKGDPMQIVPVWMGGPSLRFRNVFIGRR